MRVAVFFAPPRDHPLTEAASLWLGRDAWSGDAVEQPPVDGFNTATIRDLTAFPRRYGFHATMKPPFRIAGGHDLVAVRAALATFCAGESPATIAALRIARIGHFFALTPDGPARPVDGLAAAAVRAFEPFRAPASNDEIASRRPERLSERQRENLEAWGYPFVFDDFHFHMTLTGPVPEEHWDGMEEALRGRFSAFVGKGLAVDAVSLFVEPTPPGDFVIDTRVPLTGKAESMDAA